VCGRYAASRRTEDLVEEFEIEATEGDGPGEDPAGAEPDYNLAPTKLAPVVLERRPRTEPVAGADGPPVPAAEPVRWLRLLTWGLVPTWAKERSIGSRLINARADSLLDKPAFRRAALARRALVPADGWYEWQKSPTELDAKGRPRKQPFFVHPVDGGPIAFAAVYEFWRDPALDHRDRSAWLTTYAIVTTDAEPGLDVVHDRMPLVLDADRRDAWLDPDLRDPDAVRALLAAGEPGRFLATPVSTRVNAVVNNGPELLEPVPIELLRGVVDPATGELVGGGDAARP
jgi:putative SOS response-associated peptidase YedK